MTRLLAAFVVLLALGSVTAAGAQTCSSHVEGVNGGVLTSDPQGPSAAAVSSSLSFPGSASIDFSTDGFGEAVQRPDGVGAVLADALFANGQLGNYVEARTTWTKTATNTSASPISYVFDFFITPPSLRIADFARLPDASMNQVEVSFQATIRANGVVVFQAGAHLAGGDLSHVLTETGTSLSPTYILAGSAFGYDFSSHADVLNLGVVGPGGTMTVEYEMIARVDTPGFETGGQAKIGDPFDLDGTPGFTGSLDEDVPLPVEKVSWGRVKNVYR
jgi:hypothetical protein